MTRFAAIEALASQNPSVNLTDDHATLTLAQALSLAAQGVTFAAEDRVTVRDTAATLEGLDAAAIATLDGLGIDGIAASDRVLGLNLTQSAALKAAGLTAGSILDDNQGTSAELVLTSGLGAIPQRPMTFALDDGGTLVVWTTRAGGIEDSPMVRAQKLDALGQAVGEVQTLFGNAQPIGNQRVAAVQLASGGVAVAVVWEGDAGNYTSLVTTDDTGAILATSTVLTEATVANRLSVIPLSSGGSLVIWGQSQPGGPRLWSQAFDAAGAAQGAVQVLEADTPYYTADNVSHAVLANGNTVISWVGTTQNGSREVFARVLGPDGTPLGQTQALTVLDTDRQDSVRITAFGGGFAAIWLDINPDLDRDVVLQLYDMDGQPLGAPRVLGNYLIPSVLGNVTILPQVTTLADGGFVATWTLRVEGTTMPALHLQVFDAAGQLVATPEALAQQDLSNVSANVAALPEGGFVLTWMRHTNEVPNGDILAQVYDAQGAKVGAQILVNTNPSGNQFLPNTVVHEDGSFTVTWFDPTTTTGTASVMARTFVPATAGALIVLSAADLLALDRAALPEGVTGVKLTEAVALSTWQLAQLAGMTLDGQVTLQGQGAALAALNPMALKAQGVGRLDAWDNAITLTETQLRAFVAQGIGFAADDRVVVNVFSLAMLSPQNLADLKALGATHLDTETSSWVSTTQLDRLIASGLRLAAADVVVLADEPQTFAAMTPERIQAIFAYGVHALYAFGDVTLSAQTLHAWVSTDMMFTYGTRVIFNLTAQDLAGVSVRDMSELRWLGPVRVQLLQAEGQPAPVLTAAQALAAQGVTFTAPFGLGIADLGAQIGAIASGKFAGLAAQGITHLDATDNAYDLDLAQAKAVAAAGLTLAAGDQVRLNVSLAELALVSAADLALVWGLGIAQIASPDPVIALSGAQLQMLMGSGLALPVAAHVVLADTMAALSAANLTAANLTALRAYGVDEVQLRDTGAALGGLTYAQAASLAALGVTEIVATSPATLSLPRLMQLATLGVHFADASEVSVSLGAGSLNPDTLDLGLLDQLNIDLVDLRENVAALTYGDLQAYQAAHLGFAEGDMITARLTLAEAQWLEPGADQALRALGVDVLRVELTAAQLQNLSPTEIADLGARGITALDVTDNAARISLEQWQAIQTAHLQTAAEDRITVIQPLTLVADSATGREHDTLRVAVLANDTLPQGASVVGAFVTSGQGTVVLNADGTLSVAYAGADIDGPQSAQVTVRYTVFDGVQTSSADLTLRFTAQNENITGTGHADWLVGGAYGEQIRGGGGNDTIEGQGGNDSINAGAGDDTIIVGTTHGQDRINGGDGIDTLVISRFATQGPLTLSLQDPSLMQSLGGGTTVLNVERLDYKGTNLGTDRITGGALADRIAGNAGDDVLAGGGGADQLYGGSGNDVLTGGAGADVLYGGLGQDVFVFTAADLGGTDLGVTDQIRDFKAAEGDLMDLSALEGLEWIGTAAFTGHAKELRFAAAPGATLVQADLDGDGLSDLVIALQAGVTLREVDFLL